MSFFNSIHYGWRSIFYGLFFLFALHVIVWLNLHWDWYFPVIHVEVGQPLVALGWSIVAVALVLYTLTAIMLSSRGKGAFAEFDPPHELVTSGPYRYVRNPIAATVLLMLIGEALAFSSTGLVMMVFVSVAIAQAQAVALEEPLLLKRFGANYLDYKSRVPRWIPRLGP